MPRRIETEIQIAASPQQVWAVLADTARYPEWNPFVRRIVGNLAVGERLEVELSPPGGRAMTMRPVVLEARPDHVLRWLGSLGVSGIFDGEHAFEIEASGDNQVRFVQRESFSGVLAPILLRVIGKQTEQGFVAMNEALKQRAEAALQPGATSRA
ncbi:MAG: SRPBCC domain-containing protein [Thermomicrobiales bacterium]